MWGFGVFRILKGLCYIMAIATAKFTKKIRARGRIFEVNDFLFFISNDLNVLYTNN